MKKNETYVSICHISRETVTYDKYNRLDFWWKLNVHNYAVNVDVLLSTIVNIIAKQIHKMSVMDVEKDNDVLNLYIITVHNGDSRRDTDVWCICPQTFIISGDTSTRD